MHKQLAINTKSQLYVHFFPPVCFCWLFVYCQHNSSSSSKHSISIASKLYKIHWINFARRLLLFTESFKLFSLRFIIKLQSSNETIMEAPCQNFNFYVLLWYAKLCGQWNGNSHTTLVFSVSASNKNKKNKINIIITYK